MSIAELTRRAQTIRRQPMNDATRADIAQLRVDAERIGVRPALDAQLRALFPDVFGAAPMPPVKLTQSGPAANQAFGGNKGSALQFHQLQQQAAAKPIVGLHTTTPPAVPLEKQFAPLSAAEKRQARADLEKELGDVRARGTKGSVLDKVRSFPGLDAAQKERVLDVLAEVKHGYGRVGQALADKPGGVGYQDVNWKHTRIEVERMLDVISAGKLTPQQAEVALLASIVSDSVKTPQHFLVHNVHGAQAAQLLLGRLQPPLAKESIEDVVKATLEHQIGPPGFMGNVAMRNTLKNAGVDGALIGTICDKIAKPFESAQGTGQIVFTDAEKKALEKVGVFAWTVPQEGTRHYQAARAVIDGDSLVNYACPDGWAKLAALHGPDQPPFLQEPLLRDGLLSERPGHASALSSFTDAQNVVSPASRQMYDQGLVRTKLAIDRVMRDLERWVQFQPNVPKTADGKVPYFTGPLDYGDAQQLMFARRLREQAVTLLRQQEGIS